MMTRRKRRMASLYFIFNIDRRMGGNEALPGLFDL